MASYVHMRREKEDLPWVGGASYATLTGGVEFLSRFRSSVCFEVPVFEKMCCRWVRAVTSLIPSMAPASLTPRPGAIASNTRNSAPVSS